MIVDILVIRNCKDGDFCTVAIDNDLPYPSRQAKDSNYYGL